MIVLQVDAGDRELSNLCSFFLPKLIEYRSSIHLLPSPGPMKKQSGGLQRLAPTARGEYRRMEDAVICFVSDISFEIPFQYQIYSRMPSRCLMDDSGGRLLSLLPLTEHL